MKMNIIQDIVNETQYKELDGKEVNQIDIQKIFIIGCLNKLNREVEILLEIKRKINIDLNWDNENLIFTK